MLSRNNWKEQVRQQEPKKQRFTIKKLTIGVASVLIGFTFMGMSASANTQAAPTPANSNPAKNDQTVQGSETGASKAPTPATSPTSPAPDAQNPDTTTDRDKYQVNYGLMDIERPTTDTPVTQNEMPTVTNADTMPDGTIIYKQKIFDAPKGVTTSVDSKTGEVTVTVAKDATTGRFEVPVDISYQDGSRGVVWNVPFTIHDQTDTNGHTVQFSWTFDSPIVNLHRTTDDNTNIDVNNSRINTINFYYDWDHTSGNGNYRTTIVYKLNADGTKFVNTTDPTDSFDASGFKYEWRKGYAPNTKFGTGTGTVLAQNNGVFNPEENYRMNYTITDPSVTKKFNLATNFSTYKKVFFNFWGATTGQPLTFNQNQDISNLSQAQYRKLINVTDLGANGWNGTNVDPNTPQEAAYTPGTDTTKTFSMAWAPNGKPSTATVADGVKGTVRINFNDGTYLDVPATINVVKNNADTTTPIAPSTTVPSYNGTKVVDTPFYNNSRGTNSNLIDNQSKTGQYTFYFTAKDASGKEYASSYAAEKGNPTGVVLNSILDKDAGAYDPNSLEFHFYYQNNTDQDQTINYTLRMADYLNPYKAGRPESSLVPDGSRISDVKVTSKQGNTYDISSVTKTLDGVKSRDGDLRYVGDVPVNLTVKANDAINLVIPFVLNTTAKKSNTTIDDHNEFSVRENGQQTGYLVVRSSTYAPLFSEDKTYPVVNVGNNNYTHDYPDNPGAFTLDPSVLYRNEDFMNGFWDGNNYNEPNIYNYSTPTNKSTVYNSYSHSYLLLDKYEDYLTKHGFTVAFNNGKPRPYYTYQLGKTGAKLVDKNGNPVQGETKAKGLPYFEVVPVILLNQVEPYTTKTAPTAWDPSTMVNKVADPTNYRYWDQKTDSAVRRDNTAAQLTAKDFKVTITKDGQAVKPDDNGKYDLSKPGIYTVTYSRDFNGTTISNSGQITVVKDNADQYIPDYKDTTVAANSSVNTGSPSFTKDSKPVTDVPSHTYAFKDGTTTMTINDKNGKNPVTVTINETSGAITFTAPDDATEYDIPVTVTYKDGSSNTATAKVFVNKSLDPTKVDPTKSEYKEMFKTVTRDIVTTSVSGQQTTEAQSLDFGRTMTIYGNGDPATYGKWEAGKLSTDKFTTQGGSTEFASENITPVDGYTSYYKIGNDGQKVNASAVPSASALDKDGNPVDGTTVYVGYATIDTSVQIQVTFFSTLANLHRTTDDNTNIDVNNSRINTIKIDYDWDHTNGNGNYRKTIVYKLNTDGTKFVNTTDPTDSFDASGFKYEWRKGYAPNTKFGTGTGTVLAQSNGVYNTKQTYQMNYTITDPSVARKLNLSTNYSSSMRVYFNFWGATTGQPLTFNQNQDISNLSQAQYRQLIDVTDLGANGWNGTNVDPSTPQEAAYTPGTDTTKTFSMAWAPNGQPSTATVANGVKGTVRINFNDGTYLDVPATINVVKNNADQYIPAYKDTTAVANSSVNTGSPSFTKNSKPVTYVPRHTYAFNDGTTKMTINDKSGKNPVTVTINKTSGAITFTAPDDATEYDIPVTVTYKDGSSNTATAKVFVNKSLDPTKVDPTKSEYKEMFKTVTRDIVTTSVSGQQTTEAQSLDFGRTMTIYGNGDPATYGKWEAGKLSTDKFTTQGGSTEFASENITPVDGYTSYYKIGNDGQKVNASAVPSASALDKDGNPVDGTTTVYVGYDKNNTPTPTEDTTVTYTFYDETDKKPVEGHDVTVTGQPGTDQKVNLTTPEGYKLAEGQTLPTSVKMPKANETITINLVHATKDIKPNDPGVNPSDPVYADMFKTVTRTIKVNNPDRMVDTTTQQVNFNRTKTIDEVTDEVISYGNWTLATGSAKDWGQFNVPQLDGFISYVDGNAAKEVAEENVTADTADVTVEVTYKTSGNNGNNTNPGDDGNHNTNPSDNGNHNTNPGNNGNNNGINNGTQNGSDNKIVNTNVTDNGNGDNSQNNKQALPQTGNTKNDAAVAGLGLAGLLAMLGFGGLKKKRN